ncbi:MAG: hypothetical protein QXS83_04780, partial [Thermoplasmata archaeon]
TNTDPWNPDSDADGLKDSVEYTLGLNPLSNDTDSDQWLDAQEFQYWYILYLEMGIGVKDACAQAAKNCKTPDVDGDSITDYQEVFGYNVKIITGWGKDNTPISKEITMYGDPLRAYRQSSGAWTDTDSDGIPDIVEIYFSNVSYIDSDSLWQQMVVSNGFASTYRWCREYYQTLNASDPSKAENWTQKAFNPFVVCNLPPMITSFSAEAHEEWGWISGWGGIPYWGVKACYLTISVVVKSVTGFTMVIIGARPLDKGEDTVVHVESIWSSTATVASYSNVRLDVDWWTLKVTGYRARAYAVSYAEDMSQAKSVEASHEIKGIITLIADALANLWQMLVSGLQKVWEAVEKAVNAIVEWVKKIVEEAIKKIVEPIFKILDSWGKDIIAVVSEFIKAVEEGSAEIEKFGERLGRVFCSSQIWTLIVALSIAVSALITTLGVVLKVVTGGADILTAFIVRMFVESVKTITVGYALIEATLAGVSGIVAYLIPKDNPIWNSGVFLSVIALVQCVINFILTHPDITLVALRKTDAWGLFFAFWAVLVDIIAIPAAEIGKVVLSVCAFVLATYSLVHTVSTLDILDIVISGPLAYVEEVITGCVFCYASISLLKAIEEWR